LESSFRVQLGRRKSGLANSWEYWLIVAYLARKRECRQSPSVHWCKALAHHFGGEEEMMRGAVKTRGPLLRRRDERRLRELQSQIPPPTRRKILKETTAVEATELGIGVVTVRRSLPTERLTKTTW
jgi:hypothetical protein